MWQKRSIFFSLYEVSVSHAVGSSGGCFVLLNKALPLTNLSIVTDNNERLILCDFPLFLKEIKCFLFVQLILLHKKYFFVP